MAPRVTLLELVTVVSRYAATDAEVAATVAHMVNAGRVTLVGHFRGARIVLDEYPALDAVA